MRLLLIEKIIFILFQSKGLSRDLIKQIKQQRRTMKNRGYAAQCRSVKNLIILNLYLKSTLPSVSKQNMPYCILVSKLISHPYIYKYRVVHLTPSSQFQTSRITARQSCFLIVCCYQLCETSTLIGQLKIKRLKDIQKKFFT